MTRVYFEALPEAAKLKLVFGQGILIASRKEGHLKAELYLLHQFYVEIYYQKFRLTVEKIQSFISPAFLEPYVQELMEGA